MCSFSKKKKERKYVYYQLSAYQNEVFFFRPYRIFLIQRVNVYKVRLIEYKSIPVKEDGPFD